MTRLAPGDGSGYMEAARAGRPDCSHEQSSRNSRRDWGSVYTGLVFVIMEDSKLIELVRVHPSVYNPKHHLYKDATVRDNVWIEIGLKNLGS